MDKENDRAYCGLNCAVCEAYIATRTDDDKLREKVAKEWSEAYGHNFRPSEIDCTGCKWDGRKFGYCSMCEIRMCNVNNNYDSCADCDIFPCKSEEIVITKSEEASNFFKSKNKI
ncbi:Protein of unknown function (DUF3795) [Parelusimicrobium proximum]|uniref:DUF3795 domain-containing protein n=1 Tax=Parelusimicrobium proximum TaxID=3228953 RepID=UPI003D166850